MPCATFGLRQDRKKVASILPMTPVSHTLDWPRKIDEKVSVPEQTGARPFRLRGQDDCEALRHGASGRASRWPRFPGHFPPTSPPPTLARTPRSSSWPTRSGLEGRLIGRRRRPFGRTALPARSFEIVRRLAPGARRFPVFRAASRPSRPSSSRGRRMTRRPTRRDWTLEDAAALVAAVHVGVETAGSPSRRSTISGRCAIVADFGNNAGLIVGPALPIGAPRPSSTGTARRSSTTSPSAAVTAASRRAARSSRCASCSALSAAARGRLKPATGCRPARSRVCTSRRRADGSRSFGDAGEILCGAEPFAAARRRARGRAFRW